MIRASRRIRIARLSAIVPNGARYREESRAIVDRTLSVMQCDGKSRASLIRSFVHAPCSEQERFLSKRQPIFVQSDSRDKPPFHRLTVPELKVRSVSGDN